MSKIKVIRIIPVLDFGGVESRFILQSELMDRDRFELRVCTFWKDGKAAERIRALGIPVDVLEVDPAVRNPAASLQLWLYLMQQRPDVIHASIAEAMFHGAVASFMAGVPLRIIEDTGVPSRGRAGRVVYGTIARLVHHVIGVSQATCNYLIEQDRMPRDRVKLIYNCGKPAFFEGQRERARSASEPFKMFTAGRIVPVKNQSILVDAMNILVHERGLNVELNIAGNGELLEPLREQVDAANLGEHVKLLGFRNDVRELLDAHDAFLLPSHSEGCSIAMIEAMATGIPVLGSTTHGIVEVMGQLGEDYLIPATDLDGWVDAMQAMVNRTPEQLHALGQRARQIAHAEFSPPRYINDLESLYASSGR